MPNAARPVLDPQTENEIIDAIIALDWNTDVLTKPLEIIQSRLGHDDRQAIDLIISFQQRRLMICKPERRANNFAETGITSPPVRGRWIKPDETMK
jgi:hypothetical protein